MAFRKVKQVVRHLRIKRQISSLRHFSEYTRGSSEWLAACELAMGGFVTKVPRNRVSSLDPRTSLQINTGGMSGGDRMIHHGYASDYASHLARFLDKEDDLVIVECGILKGTGLAVWSKLFPNALLIGLDIDLEHTKRNLDALKARGAFEVTDPVLLEFDQFKPNTESLLRVLNGRKVNIVIDDGFHSNETIVNTYEALREHLAEGFVYFAEDNSEVYKKLKERHNDVSIYSYGELTVIERPKPEPPTAKSLDISTIHKAARGGNIEAVKKYLADGTEVDVKDEDGGTPLYYATGRGHKEIAELLIANDADVNAKTNDGDTPLDYANDEIADLLRKHGGKRGVELKAEGK